MQNFGNSKKLHGLINNFCLIKEKMTKNQTKSKSFVFFEICLLVQLIFTDLF